MADSLPSAHIDDSNPRRFDEVRRHGKNCADFMAER